MSSGVLLNLESILNEVVITTEWKSVWTAQVRNLPMIFFYHHTPRHPLIDHFFGGSRYIGGLSQVVIKTESKSVALELCKFEICQP
jgi:hypothetical protein